MSVGRRHALLRRQEDARATGSNHRATLRAMTNAMPYLGNDFYCDVAIPNIDNLDVIEDTASVLAYRKKKKKQNHGNQAVVDRSHNVVGPNSQIRVVNKTRRNLQI